MINITRGNRGQIKTANMNFEPSSFTSQTKIKEEEDGISNVIDLDNDRYPEDLLYEWAIKVRLKLILHIILESEHLDMLMKWYIRSIKEEVIDFEDFKTLKRFTKKHMAFFKLHFIHLNCCFVDDYLDNMEEILAFYLNLELKCLPTKQKDDKRSDIKKQLSKICRKIIDTLNINLLNREDRIYHVIMKMKLNLQSDESKDLLNLLYGKFLTKEPRDKSDLEFCRIYILYQKWKTIRKPDEWEKMDEVMYRLYERTPDSIKSNPVLKQILFPQNNSVLDTLIHISEKHVIISEEYFKYIKSNKIQEDNIIASAMNSIEIQDEDVIPHSIGDDEDEEFEAAYKNFVQSMSSAQLDKTSDECVEVKMESSSDDDDCQIVGVSSLGHEGESTDIVHEILDDDDIEIIYFKKKEDKQSIPQEEQTKNGAMSFLDSIEVSECTDVSMETVSSSTNTGRAPVQDKTNALAEISSTNGRSEVADSPMSNSSGSKPSTEILEADVTEAQPETVPEDPTVETETLGAENDSNREETAGETPVVPSVDEKKKQNVVSIETQTDDWPPDDNQDKGKRTEQTGVCRSYYYYGLVTPPSDQLPDEHVPPSAGSATYPNVYANIVRSRSPDELDNLTKATETDSLSSSADDNDTDNNAKSSSNTSLSPPTSVIRNGEYVSDPPFPLDDDRAKKKQKNSNGSPEFDGLHLIADSEENVPFENQTNDAIGQDLINRNETVSEKHPEDDVSSLEINTNVYGKTDNDAYLPALQYEDDNLPETSTGAPCSSPDFIVTSAVDEQVNPAGASTASPDVTSTSADVQDFHEVLPCEDAPNSESLYHHLTADMCEANNESYYSEEYVEYSNVNANEEYAGTVTQSNLEDGEDEEIYLEDPVLMSNGEELTYFVDEALSVGANVNISTEELTAHDPNQDEAGAATENEEKRAFPLKELKVSVEKISLSSCENRISSPSRIMFASSTEKPSADEFSKFEEKVHLRWSRLKETHDLDEMFCGPVTKINGTSCYPNPDTSFDLFSAQPAVTTGSGPEVTSPAYEGIDDFRSYYEQSKNIIVNKTPVREENIAEKNAGTVIPRALTTLRDVDPAPRIEPTKPKNVKRVHIVETIMDSRNSIPQLPTETRENVLRGILKKPHSSDKRRSGRGSASWRIPAHMMNMKSLEHYNVAPDDSRIQEVPRTVLERLSDSKISQWLRVNEISKKVRREKRTFFNTPETIRVDYDKQSSSQIGKKDTVWYNTLGEIVKMSVPETFGQWRSDSVTKSNRPDEGLQELPYTEKKTGKRKRQSSVTVYSNQTPKRGPVCRKAPVKSVEEVGGRKTTRKRKKLERD